MRELERWSLSFSQNMNIVDPRSKFLCDDSVAINIYVTDLPA